MFDLRDYQRTAVEFVARWAADAKPGDKLLLASPTGTGKSYMELAIQEALPGACLVTPKIEIIAGLLAKLGEKPADSLSALLEQAAVRRLFTPLRLRSALLKGSYPAPPLLLFDEAHHDLAESWQDIHLLCGYAPAIGFTASPFRGTPAGTAKFREQWGEPEWVITFPEAVGQGALAMPSCSTIPLVDDDQIEVQNGELVARQINHVTAGRIGEIATLAARYQSCGRWDAPTMFSLPSRELCHALHTALGSVGLPSVVVTGETTHGDRWDAFQACVACQAALIQVAVVSEGVDLPIRRLIDLSPTISPVKWLQQFGRITRSGDVVPEYICTNRNLLRHGYLLEGCLPAAAVMQAQAAFPTSKRGGLRAIGLEALGRLQPVELPLKSGLKALAYSLSALNGHLRTDYFVFVHPLHADLLWATRESVRGEGEAIAYGRWHRCEPPNDLTGFASLPPSSLSEKQAAWWRRSAASVGLDSEAEITRKQFPALPVLCDMKARLS